MLIGITGRKGHGKDSVGAALRGVGFTTVAFADPLKDALKVALGFTEEQVRGSNEAKEAVDPRYGVSPRHAMQTLGTEWGRRYICEDVWVQAAFARVEAVRGHVAITDVRFPNEAEAVRARGGVVWKVYRPGWGSGQHENHASELDVEKIVPDVELRNDGTLNDLRTLTLRVLDGPWSRRE